MPCSLELGDPMRLAAGYTGRPLHLIGPAIFPEWRRLVTLLLWTVVPVVTLINLVLRLFIDDLASEGVGAAFASSAGLGLQVALHVVFWTTLVYALVERSQPGKALIAWDPDQLPEDDRRSVGIGETVSSVVMLLLVGLALIWQQTNSPLEVDGESVPVLDPALWSGWIPFLLGVVVAQIVVALAVFRARRWTLEPGCGRRRTRRRSRAQPCSGCCSPDGCSTLTSSTPWWRTGGRPWSVTSRSASPSGSSSPWASNTSGSCAGRSRPRGDAGSGVERADDLAEGRRVPVDVRARVVSGHISAMLWNGVMRMPRLHIARCM